MNDAEDVVYVRAFDASVFRAVVFTFRLTGVGWTCQSMLQDMAWPAALPTALYKHLLDFFPENAARCNDHCRMASCEDRRKALCRAYVELALSDMGIVQAEVVCSGKVLITLNEDGTVKLLTPCTA